MPRRLPILRALAAQLLAAALVGLLGYFAAALFHVKLPLLVAAAIHGLIAAAIGHRLGLQRWWWIINFAFAPALLLLIALNVPPWACLAAFALLLLLNWNSLAGGVPLYLTGDATCDQIAGLIRHRGETFRFIDLGSGLAGTLCRLSRRFPKAQFEGVETAPLVFLASWLRCLIHPNCRVRYQSLWNVNLAPYDIVYCFLSPVPMPGLWKKAQAQMRPHALLISNTFEIPGVRPKQVVEMKDWRGSKLYLWTPNPEPLRSTTDKHR